ncbi:MAG: site-specific integrase, partial [Bacillota bacterium]
MQVVAQAHGLPRGRLAAHLLERSSNSSRTTQPSPSSFLVAMAAGLRRGELLGLTWADIDFEGGRICVRQQWNRTPEGASGLVPLKTEASRRDVEVPSDVLDALAAHKVTQEAQGLAPLVFDRGDGACPSRRSNSTGHGGASDRTSSCLPPCA